MTQELEQAAIELKEKQSSLVVQDDDGYKFAASLLTEAKKREKDIKTFFKPLKQKASEAHKAIVAEEKKFLSQINIVVDDCNQKMITYQDEQERIKREEAAKKAEEIRKQQEEIKMREALEAESSGDK